MERFRSARGPSSVGSVGAASNARTRGPHARRRGEGRRRSSRDARHGGNSPAPGLEGGREEGCGGRCARGSSPASGSEGGSEGCLTRRGLLPVGELEDERGAEEEDEGKGIEADLWVPHCFLGCNPRWYAT